MAKGITIPPITVPIKGSSNPVSWVAGELGITSEPVGPGSDLSNHSVVFTGKTAQDLALLKSRQEYIELATRAAEYEVVLSLYAGRFRALLFGPVFYNVSGYEVTTRLKEEPTIELNFTGGGGSVVNQGGTVFSAKGAIGFSGIAATGYTIGNRAHAYAVLQFLHTAQAEAIQDLEARLATATNEQEKLELINFIGQNIGNPAIAAAAQAYGLLGTIGGVTTIMPPMWAHDC